MEYTEIEQETLDIDWFAVDQNGNVAHFASGGGPLPMSVAISKENNIAITDFIKSMKSVSNYMLSNEAESNKINMSSKEFDRFIREFAFFSSKGLFSYEKERIDIPDDSKYTLITSPIEKITIKDFPEEIIKIIKITFYQGYFDNLEEIDISSIA